jgi:DNA-binding CsgD family transcriptional regulator
MGLVDRNRCYVDINDAAVELYQYPREEAIGSVAGRTAVDADPGTGDAEWEQLLRTNELYGDRVVTHANGTLIHVSFAAHATTVVGRWLALFVVLSTHAEPDGPELIGATEIDGADDRRSQLTAREREVVRLVALGAGTRQIAGELCVSPDTVRSHIRNAMGKTNSHTRAQLVAITLANGLIAG